MPVDRAVGDDRLAAVLERALRLAQLRVDLEAPRRGRRVQAGEHVARAWTGVIVAAVRGVLVAIR